ncbi:MAG: hypothetical protein V2A70_00875 [Candidatus Omnitrophota bacterium]
MKMKVTVFVMTLLFLGAGAGVNSFAQGMEGMMGDEPMKHKGMMMGAEGQEHGKMGMRPVMGMMKDMMAKSMVASSDGGVIVLVGNKLMKYDKNLALVKEVEIKIDMAAMQKDMMKNCPMMKGTMMGAGMGAEEKVEKKK